MCLRRWDRIQFTVSFLCGHSAQRYRRQASLTHEKLGKVMVFCFQSHNARQTSTQVWPQVYCVCTVVRCLVCSNILHPGLCMASTYHILFVSAAIDISPRYMAHVRKFMVWSLGKVIEIHWTLSRTWLDWKQGETRLCLIPPKWENNLPTDNAVAFFFFFLNDSFVAKKSPVHPRTTWLWSIVTLHTVYLWWQVFGDARTVRK